MKRVSLFLGLAFVLSSSFGAQEVYGGHRYALVTGFESDNVVRFDLSTGTAETAITLQPNDYPRGITVDEENRIYIALRGGTQNVKRFTWNGAFIDNFTQSIGGYGCGQIGFSTDGNLIVGGDVSQNSSVFRYDGDTGQLIDTFRLAGLTNVVGLLVSGQTVYSAAYFSGNVARYDLNQHPVTGIPFIYGNGLVSRIIGLTVGHNGNLFLASGLPGLVQEFDIVTGLFVGTFLFYGVTDIKYDASVELYYAIGGDSVREIDQFGNVVRVLQSGLLSDAYSITIVVIESTGACCYADGNCSVMTETQCQTPNSWQGPETTCDPSPCPPVGACCAPEGVCTALTEAGCPLTSIWQGPGTPCDPNPCPQPGACCFGQLCLVLFESDCTGNYGGYLGDNAPCEPNPCPVYAAVPEGSAGLAPGVLAISPNPFHRATAIRCRLLKPGPVSLQVIGSSGRVVRTLQPGVFQGGDVTLSWDGRDDQGRQVPAGVYVVKVVTPTGETSGRAVLAK